MSRPALDASPASPPTAIRCRLIGEPDLHAVVALLVRGFRDRSADYWWRGLRRQESRRLPPGCPVYGYMLESDGHAVGVLLTLYSAIESEGWTTLRCNLSSWYVEPEFRVQAVMLDSSAQRRKDVTFLNVSPAPHTFALQEARGFRRYCQGQMFALPALSRVRRGLGTRLVDEADPLEDLPPAERELVRDHLAYGCVCLVCGEGGRSQPIIFLKRRIGLFKRQIGSGLVPCLQLVFCRDIQDFPSLAGSVGRLLLRTHRIPWIVLDAAGPIPGLVGRYFADRAPKYTRGPEPVRLGDLAYTELVIFGP